MRRQSCRAKALAQSIMQEIRHRIIAAIAAPFSRRRLGTVATLLPRHVCDFLSLICGPLSPAVYLWTKDSHSLPNSHSRIGNDYNESQHHSPSSSAPSPSSLHAGNLFQAAASCSSTPNSVHRDWLCVGPYCLGLKDQFHGADSSACTDTRIVPGGYTGRRSCHVVYALSIRSCKSLYEVRIELVTYCY